jgi:chromosome segregation ATPase
MDEAIFKTSVMGGFKKDEVLKFIDELDAKHKAREEELSKKIEELSESLSSAEEKNGEFEAKEMLLEDAIAAEKEENNLLGETVGQLTAQLQTLRGEAEENARREKSLKGEIDWLKTQLRDAADEQAVKDSVIEGLENDVRQLQDEIERFGDSEEKIARVLMDARYTADKILKDARENADTELEKAQSKIDVLASKVKEFKDAINRIREDYADFSASVDGVLVAIVESAQNIEDEFRDAAAEQADGEGRAVDEEPFRAVFDFSAESAASEEACGPGADPDN